MSRHLIRTDLLPSLLHTIAPIARKCQKKNIPYEYKEIGKQYKETEINGRHCLIEFTEIELNINPCINGWNVIVQIEKQDSGNNLITRCNVPYSKEYDKYITEEIHCEHCKQHRKRNTAYILKNEKTEETIIVGSTCLEEFTGGLDASITAKCFESINKIHLIENECKNYSNISQNIILYQLEYILSIAFAVIKNDGYYIKNSMANSTTNKVKEYLQGNANVINGNVSDNYSQSIEYISWIRNYLSEKEELNSYERNVKTICESENVCWREIATLCSIIPVYQRNNKKEQQEEKLNEYYGEIKQRITITIKDVKTHSFDSMFGTFFIHVLTSDDGYVFVWKTNKNICKRKYVYLKNGDVIDSTYVPLKLKGTISDHEEYNGTKQTVLKRCELCSIVLKNINTNEIIDENSDEIDYIN